MNYGQKYTYKIIPTHDSSLACQARRKGGGTQMQLAERLGVNQTFVSKVEICERRLDIVELLTICEILEISFVDFIKEIDEDIISKFKQSKNNRKE